jgi:hypothetical protein
VATPAVVLVLAWTLVQPLDAAAQAVVVRSDRQEPIIRLVQQTVPEPALQPPSQPAPQPAPETVPEQPEAARPSAPRPAAPSRRETSGVRGMSLLGASTGRTPVLRLASVPNMLGDFYGPGGQFATTGGNFNSVADLPAAGGGCRTKVAENNKALPMNRCYLMYHHYHNALSSDLDVNAPGTEVDADVNRYSLGLERMFLDGRWSVDVRMPFYEGYELQAGSFGVEGGEIGNLSVTLKRLVAISETGAAAVGLGADLPTGDDVFVQDLPNEYTVRNQAVHLSPFVGFLRLPTPCTFVHGFAQVDVPVNGNRVDYLDTGLGQSGSFGDVTEQTMLYLDVAGGYWLYRDACASGITGLASLVEFHYATTLQDADVLTGTLGATSVQFGNLANRLDVTNITVGLHTEIRGRSTLRCAGVFPLQDIPDRPFDAELQITFNRYY